MTTYQVTVTVYVDAESPREAYEQWYGWTTDGTVGTFMARVDTMADDLSAVIATTRYDEGEELRWGGDHE